MIDRYLERIRWSSPLLPNLDTLRRLHRQHMLCVPFENLDIHWKRPIVLDEERLLDKIVRQRRGGFCYELNGAFAVLLRAIGFDVERLSGRVICADGSYGPEFDHMALLVRLEDGSRWLTDVGFGDSFLEPLSLDTEATQQEIYSVWSAAAMPPLSEDDRERWRGHRSPDDWAMRVLRNGKWSVDYYFTLQPHELSEYVPMCTYHQTSSESSFTKKRVCSVATERGRITLTDGRFIETIDGDKREREVGDEEWRDILRERFGIVLSS